MSTSAGGCPVTSTTRDGRRRPAGADVLGAAHGPAGGRGTEHAHLAIHSLSPDEAPRVHRVFEEKTDGCGRAVIRPGD